MKIITAAQAGALIPDNATIFLGGLAVSSLPEEVLKGIEKNFLDHGSPKNVTTWPAAPSATARTQAWCTLPTPA